MAQGIRKVPANDKARFWQAIHSGHTTLDACRIAGVHPNTGYNWIKKSKVAKANADVAAIELTKHTRRQGGVQWEAAMDLAEAADLPPAIPLDRLTPEAQRGLDDFQFFREHYLGRVSAPWQVEAALEIVKSLDSEEKEFICLNVPPGAGKSTLFHDVAVWAIVKNRAIRVLIGSANQNLAKMYSRRIRETLERPNPMLADPELAKKGLAQDAQGCLSIDYGRFKPADKGALWRAEEFIVEQLDGNGLDNKEPTVRAYGIDAEFIGHRADLCLFDDVASTENARESTARDKLLERWDSMAEARVDPGGTLVVVGQRLGSGDLYAHCLNKVTYDLDEDDYDGEDVTATTVLEKPEPTKKQKYKHIIYKAYYEDLDTGPKSRRLDAPAYPNGPLLDPKRLSWKDLSYLRSSNNERFRVIYQQEDLADETYLVDRTWITGGLGQDGVLYQGCIDNERLPEHIPPGLRQPVVSIISIDPSPTQFWGLIWMLYQPELNLYHIIDIQRTKLTAENLLGYNTTDGTYTGILQEWCERAQYLGYPVTHIIVEINAAQRFLLQHDFVRRWTSKWGLNILPHTTNRNKLDQNLGIEAVLPPLARSGALRMPTMRGNWKTLALVDELCKWTRDKKNGTDLAMALWFACLHAPNLTNIKRPPRQWRPSWI
jgi:hypothetical protein